jgi:hypothetical protein
VSEYLDRGGSKLTALREAVTTDPVLQELAQTPLMLSVMSLACQGAGCGDELTKQRGDSTEERRKQIFGLYVERMFQRKGTNSRAFARDKTIGWLSWLAREMRDQSLSVFFVEGLQPSWLGTRAQRVGYGTIAGSSLGLIFWAFFMIILTVKRTLSKCGTGRCDSHADLRDDLGGSWWAGRCTNWTEYRFNKRKLPESR